MTEAANVTVLRESLICVKIGVNNSISCDSESSLIRAFFQDQDQDLEQDRKRVVKAPRDQDPTIASLVKAN